MEKTFNNLTNFLTNFKTALKKSTLFRVMTENTSVINKGLRHNFVAEY
jgi:hypothetical protein